MKDPRCLIGMHKYVAQHSNDGSASFLECRRCGKATPINSGFSAMFGATGPSGDR